MRRPEMIQTLAIAGAIALGMAAGQAAAAEKLTVVSWGGAYSKSQLEAYHKPYTKMTGVKFNLEDYNGDLGKIKAQVRTGNVTWDLVDLELSAALRGCDQGLLEKIDHKFLPKGVDGTPAAKDFVPGGLTKCAVGTIVWSTIVAYDSTKFKGAKPSTIKDFFDVKKFPGKRGMRKAAKVNLEWALMADGVAGKDIYKVLATKKGQDRAFKVLDRIKNHVVWWSAGAQPPQLLAAGEVTMTSAYNGRIFNAQVAEKKPFVIIWDGQVFDLDAWGIPKGSKNKAAALKFIAFSTDSQRLADQAKYISYGPARKSSGSLVGKHATTGADMKPHMPTSPKNFKTALQINHEFWRDYQDELKQRFDAWVTK